MTTNSSTVTSTLRGWVLDRARRLTEGERSALYGAPVDNFELTARVYNAISAPGSPELWAGDAVRLMIANKLARLLAWRGDPRQHEDTFVDIVAYIAILYEVLVAAWEEEEEDQ